MAFTREKATKIIKKTGRILAWFLGIIFLLFLGGYFALRSSAVQTWLAQRIALSFSKDLHTKVTVRGVDIEFFKKAVLEGVYVEDQHGDTLFYADRMKTNIHHFDYVQHYLAASDITLSGGIVKVKKYKGEHGLNFKFLLDFFAPKDTTKKSTATPWNVSIGKISLENFTFAYIDTRDTVNDRGMDYENIRFSSITTHITNIDPMGDSVAFRLHDFCAKERSGFQIDSFAAFITAADTFARFDNLFIKTPESNVKGFLAFQFHSPDDIGDDFVHKVKMKGHFSGAILQLGDLAYFSPNLTGIQKRVMITGDFKGSVDRLRCKNMDVRFGDHSHIAGDFSFNGLPDIEQTDMEFTLREALTDKQDLAGIPLPPFDQHKTMDVDDNVGLLGDMRFEGTFEGFYYDFVAHGELTTALGNMHMENIAMTRMDDGNYAYNGSVLVDNFNIGKFYDINGVQRVSGNLNIKGTGLSKNNIDDHVDGNISKLEFLGYPYSNISVTDGHLARQIFSGNYLVRDPNVHFAFHGNIDFSKSVPEVFFDAQLDSANLGALGFTDKSQENILSAKFNLGLRGKNIDDITGTILVDTLVYSKDGIAYRFNHFSFLAGKVDEHTRNIFIKSDICEASLTGQYELAEVKDLMIEALGDYIPAYFPAMKRTPSELKHDLAYPDHFKLTLTFKNNTKPIEAVFPGLSISPGTYFTGSYNEFPCLFEFKLISDGIAYNNHSFDNVNLSVNNTTQKGYAKLEGTIGHIGISDTIGMDNFTINSDAINNVMVLNFGWQNQSEHKNYGTVNAKVNFHNDHSFQANLFKADVWLSDSEWTVSRDNAIAFDSTHLNISNLVFNSGSQSVGLNGAVAHDTTSILRIDLQNMNLAWANLFTKKYGVEMSGKISGQTALSGIFQSPVFTSNTAFSDFVLNDHFFGDGEMDAGWDKSKQGVQAHAHFSDGKTDPNTNQILDNIIFSGYYYPNKTENSLDFNAHLAAISLNVLTPYLKDFCSQMDGTIAGDVSIKGTPDLPKFDGKMMVEPKLVKVDYLGLYLTGTAQTVAFDDNSLFFDDFLVKDMYGDSTTIFGHLYFPDLKRFQLDMDLSFNHFLVLNTTSAMNEQYYGRMFATGYMNIFGFLDDVVSVKMDASTDKIVYRGKTITSEFNIPMSGDNEASSSDFVSFVSKNVKADSLHHHVNMSGMDLQLTLHATTDATVKVIFDKTVGDELSATGSGDLQMAVPPSGDFTLTGQYTVDKGKYLFTMKNLVLIPFDIAKGGTISWSGDPYTAQINADAVYKTTASVEPFFPLDSTNQAYHRSYPVDVIMHLSEALMNPNISFDINLPTADQNIQETVRSYTQTDLEKNKQVLSLMVLNSFMTPTELREGQNAANSGYGSAGTTLLSNFVSGTLNNWLSQISNNVTMEMKYRPNQDMTTQELKLYLSTQLMNNRMSIDADVGKVNNSQLTTSSTSTSQLVGDVNVQYKITPDGKVQVHAFNRSNDNTILNASAPYTQGVGILYREEFETGDQFVSRVKGYFKKDKKGKKKQ